MRNWTSQGALTRKIWLVIQRDHNWLSLTVTIDVNVNLFLTQINLIHLIMKTQHHSTKIMNLESTHQIVPINSNFEMIIIVTSKLRPCLCLSHFSPTFRICGHGSDGHRCPFGSFWYPPKFGGDLWIKMISRWFWNLKILKIWWEWPSLYHSRHMLSVKIGQKLVFEEEFWFEFKKLLGGSFVILEVSRMT